MFPLQAEEAARAAEEGVGAVRQRAAQADGSAKAREKELERLGKLLEMTRCSETELSGKV